MRAYVCVLACVYYVHVACVHESRQGGGGACVRLVVRACVGGEGTELRDNEIGHASSTDPQICAYLLCYAPMLSHARYHMPGLQREPHVALMASLMVYLFPPAGLPVS